MKDKLAGFKFYAVYVVDSDPYSGGDEMEAVYQSRQQAEMHVELKGSRDRHGNPRYIEEITK